MPQNQNSVAVLKTFPLFHQLSEKQLESLLGKMKIERYQDNELIFKFNDEGDKLYLIESGEVEFFHTDPGGKEDEPINPIGPGHFFGEVALLTDGTRTMSARARTLTITRELPKTEFQAFLRDYPDATYGLLKDMASRLRVSGYMLRYAPRNLNQEHPETALDRLFHQIARMCGNLGFIALHILGFAGWIFYNTVIVHHLDPPPFAGLALFVGVEALLIVCVVLGSETRQAKNEFERNEEEYHANVNSAQATLRLVELAESLQHEIADLKRQSLQALPPAEGRVNTTIHAPQPESQKRNP